MITDKIGEMEKRANKIGRKYHRILNHPFLSNNILLETQKHCAFTGMNIMSLLKRSACCIIQGVKKKLSIFQIATAHSLFKSS